MSAKYSVGSFPMFFQRTISIIVLVAFTLVIGAAAVHVHEHQASATSVLSSQADDDATASSECGLCHVTKERAVHTTHQLDAYYTTVSTLQQPLVANLVSDRCPLRIAGRAPPGK